jgi:ankyrin repeat protein
LCECFGPLVLLLIGVALIAIRLMAEPDGRAAAKAEALFDAAKRGDVAGLEAGIADGMPVDAVEQGSRMTPVMWAVHRHHGEAARWLLAHGEDVHARAGAFGTPLVCAAAQEDGVEMVRLLLEHGADPNRGSYDGHTPLMSSAEYGDAAGAELLIRAGARVNAGDRWGNTAMTFAATSEYDALVRLLVAAGAEPPAEPDRIASRTPRDRRL